VNQPSQLAAASLDHFGKPAAMSRRRNSTTCSTLGWPRANAVTPPEAQSCPLSGTSFQANSYADDIIELKYWVNPCWQKKPAADRNERSGKAAGMKR